MPRTPLELLKRKPVEVRANGIMYRGVLIEVTEQDITLRGLTGFVTIPMNRVSSVRDPRAPETNRNPKYVDASFYTADESAPSKKEPKAD